MTTKLEFADLLCLIDERSADFRAAVAAAPSLDVQVPTCPEWTLSDLTLHLGEGRRAWAATVAAGPADAKSVAENAPAAPQEREALVAWLAASTQELVNALWTAGPDRGCWTWWGTSETPQTAGAVARHQLHEIALHTYDAQLAVGAPQPLPDEVALDGVDEFLATCCATTNPWPTSPPPSTSMPPRAVSGASRSSADGARITRLPTPGPPADTTLRGTANELNWPCTAILMDSLKIDGDRGLIDLFRPGSRRRAPTSRTDEQNATPERHRSPRTLSKKPEHPVPAADPDLRADCANCFGLCCVALPLSGLGGLRDQQGRRQPCRTCETTSAAASTPSCGSGASPDAPSTTASARGRRSPR